ncbi:MAG: acyl-ACP--UDP-N-acetylglucosamine O-acyltransferase [Candidatus Porifericomitaceae bacterium WSBS_2022_MAG_OTU9]
MIHPSSIVDSSAEIASDVKIGPFTVIGPGVRIGAGCEIGQSTHIDGPTVIGEGNHIYPFCSIGSDPQDKKHQRGSSSCWLRIGNGNTIREYSSINRATLPDSETVLGNNNWIMAYVHIAHDCIVGNDCVLANQVALSGHVQLDDYVTISGCVGVAQFCRIGTQSFCAGSTVLDSHVPPFALVAGDRAKFIGLNSIGMSRRGYSEQQIAHLKKLYRQFYQSTGRREENLAKIKECAAPEQALVDEFISFIDSVSDSRISIVPHSKQRLPAIRQQA